MSANRNDIIAFEEILNGISIKNGKVGRPKSRLKSVYADGIYDSQNTRNFLRKKDIISNINTFAKKIKQHHHESLRNWRVA